MRSKRNGQGVVFTRAKEAMPAPQAKKVEAFTVPVCVAWGSIRRAEDILDIISFTKGMFVEGCVPVITKPSRRVSHAS